MTLSSQMWAIFGHGSPAFRQANHRQKEGLLYFRQVLRREFDKDTAMENECLRRLSISSMTADSMPQEVSTAGAPVSLPKPQHTPFRETDLKEYEKITDKGIRMEVVVRWGKTLDIGELELMRDAIEAAIAARDTEWEDSG